MKITMSQDAKQALVAEENSYKAAIETEALQRMTVIMAGHPCLSWDGIQDMIATVLRHGYQLVTSYTLTTSEYGVARQYPVFVFVLQSHVLLEDKRQTPDDVL